ncbi:MAG: hypothetical protein ACRD96_27380, partial [Bryobacteraceae bacterium]
MLKTACLLLILASLAPAQTNVFANLPVAYERNRGQADPAVEFLGRAGNYTVFLTASEAVFAARGAGVRMRLDGSQQSRPQGVNMLPGISSYFTGDSDQWITGIPQYGSVEYPNVYPGVNLVFHSQGGRVEYDFLLAPEADPDRIRLVFEGATNLGIDSSGDLVLETPAGQMRHHAPVVTQEMGGARRRVEAGFRLDSGGVVAFRIGAYDKRRALHIDPAVTFATYLGGNDTDIGWWTGGDSLGNGYVAGGTLSLDFP